MLSRWCKQVREGTPVTMSMRFYCFLEHRIIRQLQRMILSFEILQADGALRDVRLLLPSGL